MARECFCGCGREIGRRHKTINKRGAELRFLTVAIETHSVPAQEGYLLFSERHPDDPNADAEAAREGAEAARETVEYTGKVQDQVAAAIHEDDPSQVLPENLKYLVDLMKAQDAKVRELCLKVGVKYGDVPQLGPRGILEAMERKAGKAPAAP